MKKVILLGLLLALVTGLAYAEVFKIKNVEYGTTVIKATEKSSGKYLWQSITKDSKINYKGQDMVYSEQTGNGVYNGKEQSWLMKGFFALEGNKITPYQVIIVFKDKDGSVIQTVEKYFDQKNKKYWELLKTAMIKSKRARNSILKTMWLTPRIWGYV